MLVAVSQQVNSAKSRPEFRHFCLRTRQDHILKLWEVIGPLLFPKGKSIVAGAGEALRDLISEAHDLAIDLYSTPYHTRFHFPETNEKFDLVTMVSMNSWNAGNTHGSMKKLPKVKLSMTPITKIGDNSLVPPRVRLVTTAKVILHVPDEKGNKANSPGTGRTPKKGGTFQHVEDAEG
jgi:hypothetical protein